VTSLFATRTATS